MNASAGTTATTLSSGKAGLGATLNADYEALRNDLDQATGLASDFQRQLAGKSNEHALLKQLFEKTQKDLAHMQTGIMELREERHRLANEAMRAVALELRLKDACAARDLALADATAARQSVPAIDPDTEARFLSYDKMIARLTDEVASLKHQLAVARRGRFSPGVRDVDPQVKGLVADISEAFERLKMVIDRSPAAPKARPTLVDAMADEGPIEIAFQR